MSNMSYCRFENTARDMYDCLEAIDNEDTRDLSETEVDAIQEFLQYAKDIVELEDEINYCVQLSNDETIKTK